MGAATLFSLTAPIGDGAVKQLVGHRRACTLLCMGTKGRMRMMAEGHSWRAWRTWNMCYVLGVRDAVCWGYGPAVLVGGPAWCILLICEAGMQPALVMCMPCLHRTSMVLQDVHGARG